MHVFLQGWHALFIIKSSVACENPPHGYCVHHSYQYAKYLKNMFISSIRDCVVINIYTE